MTTNTVSPLRQRMIEDMNARKLCVGTQRGHIRSCKRLQKTAKHPCPCCGSPMRIIETFLRGQQPQNCPTPGAPKIRIDTS